MSLAEDLYAPDPRDRDPELVEDDPFCDFDPEVDPEWARVWLPVTFLRSEPELLGTATEANR